MAKIQLRSSRGINEKVSPKGVEKTYKAAITEIRKIPYLQSLTKRMAGSQSKKAVDQNLP